MAERTKPKRVTLTLDQREEIFRLYTIARMEQAEIAKRFGVTQQTISKTIQRIIGDRTGHRVDEWRIITLRRLDDLEREVRKIMARRWPRVSGGKVVYETDHDTGQLVRVDDPSPNIKAAGVLAGVLRDRVDLLGLKAPVRVSVEALDLEGQIAALLEDATVADGDHDDDDASRS